ncbi:hypothetical protein POM88_012218 [Heracleum sosnowskyi]|uniref:BED-type domain-containing protein n=1 Tax=Heracleum sosnowskyi TaxID=360622 RepID=A0AAD8IZG5_9APIA|nr:hypothetical protein POM88_012218 [Heracleum sosnowskyi]
MILQNVIIEVLADSQISSHPASLSSSIVLFSLLHSRLHSSRFKVIKMTSQNDEISEPIANEAPDDVPIAEPDVTADKEPAEPPTQAQIQSQGTKKRALRSGIWEMFTEDKVRKIASCTYCNKEYVHDSKTNGTSTLWNHAKKCPKNPSKRANKNQPILSFEMKKEGSGTLKGHIFSAERYPRYKMKYVRWNIKRLCENESERSSIITTKVEEALERLFRFYESSSVNRNSSYVSESRGVRGDTIASADGMDMYAILEEERSKQWEMDMIAENSDENRSELELFMLDRIEAQTKDFDILLWWKAPEEPIHLRDMLVELEKYEEIAQDLDAAMELDGTHDNSD